jgi:hypothetical protein
MHKNATKCNETLSKWCKNKHGASKIIDTFETYQQQRMETEAKANEAADAAAREPLPPPPFMTQQDFAQYMRTADERQRMLIECQIKMVQDVMDRNREVQNEGVHGVSLVDFLNTRPLPFASAPELMDAEDWLLDT